MKLYTFVVHYLQMCMKEYGCCPKFKRGIIQLILSRKGGRGMYLVSATPTKLPIEFL
jgi:hypothetical protein